MLNDTINFFEDNGFGHLVLNSPPKNEMNSAFFAQLAHLNEKIFPKLSIKGMIVYGQGRHFSSGADIDELKKMIANNNYKYFRKNINDVLSLREFSFPVVAAINGSCLGSALELTLACHYRIAAHRAVFSFPEITFNLMPGLGGTYLLPQIIGKAAAIDLMLSARTLLAEEAYDIGLVDMVVNKNEIINTAKMLIKKLNHPRQA